VIKNAWSYILWPPHLFLWHDVSLSDFTSYILASLAIIINAHLLSLKPYRYGIFEVLMVTMKITVFRDVTPFGLIDVYQCLGVMLVNIYQTTWCHCPNDCNLFLEIYKLRISNPTYMKFYLIMNIAADHIL
jgi:hypothetical protein